ncbi:phosphoadenosine phosphosulfate reductase domain-containing protein [Paenibacillus abyssi]|uniref:Phosphoadenosine phosphosulphate reductase domain-containing protein n=1 Tax=Paenibacillus abyssi TaxID=1340531 RepID=A0A917G2A3_9BACL|nr:phosphoadenosine phosphosulfate reductase family protein [Paenibacillus abyssi]GGG18287.1 hypothetical protein GCM10010916_38900 [Paenibacillus abyssi]
MDEYRFEIAENKVIAQENIKRHTPISKQLWCAFKDAGYSFYGATRDWSIVIGLHNHFWGIHHFIDDTPETMMIDEDSGLDWSNMFPEHAPIHRVLTHLKHSGFEITIPEQCFVDAALQEVLYGAASWHLQSPKHKLCIWARSQAQSFLIESFPDKQFPPYGLKEEMAWPYLEMVDYEQLSFFGDLPLSKERRRKRPAPPTNLDEQFIIDDFVPADIEEWTDRAIEKVFLEQEVVVVAFSGGKDSYVLLLKCIMYKLNHPECKTELHIVSADTGVENPLLKEHIRKVQQAVWSLPIHIPFTIAEPAIEDRYFVCLFGKNYAPPSQNFKWCVERVKVRPGREVLAEYTGAGRKVCQLLGLRESESQTRSSSIDSHYGENFYGNHVVSGIKTCAPIRHWSARHVVTFLVRNSPPWENYGNYNLLNLYGSAMGGVAECPIGAAIGAENDAIKACSGSGSRFGCFVCSVVGDDISLRNMIGDYPELEPYYRLRGLLKKAQDIRYGFYTAFQRKGRNRFEPGFGNMNGDGLTILAKRMIELGIRIEEAEVQEIIRQIVLREYREGNAISPRFREAIFAHLPLHPLFTAQMYDSILDPEGVIDRRTSEDREAIERILQMEKDGLLTIE